jgi:hypothetical protein
MYMKKIGLLFLLGFALFRCDGDPETCTVPATVRDYTGLDGCRFVFVLEDGTALEPVRYVDCGTPPLPAEVTEDPLYDFEFVDGKKVFISYTETGSPSICMVGPVVKITCIKEAPAISEE